MTPKNNDKIIIYSTRWCPDCHRAKHFLDEHGVDYMDIDVEADEAAMLIVKQINGGRRVVPTLVFSDGSILVEPSNSALADKLNVADESDFEW